jgi:hypothetical protein
VRRLAILASLLFACGREGVIEVRIVAPPGQDPFAGAVVARLTLGTTPPLVREFPIQSGRVEGEIKPAPTNVAPQITVELLDDRGEVLSRGRTPEVPLSARYTGYVEVLVARVGAFARLPSGLATATRGHSAAVISRFQVLIAGGLDGSGAPVARAEIYNLYLFGFEPTGGLATPRARGVLLPLSDGRFLVYGGQVPGSAGGLAPTATVEVYDPQAGTFSGAQGGGQPRAAPVAVALPDSPDRWIVTGGEGSSGEPLATAMLFSVGTGELTALAETLRAARRGHTATPVQTAAGPRVLIFGGADADPEAELFDPIARTFSPLPTPLGRRRDHTATLLSDGRVALAGGRSAAGEPLADIVLYDPQCDDVRCPVFALDLALLSGRYGHAAHALPGDRLLIAAGRGAGGTALATAEVLLYESAARRLTRESSPALSAARAEFVSVDLPTGQILLAGGVDASGAPTASAEIFNPR